MENLNINILEGFLNQNNFNNIDFNNLFGNQNTPIDFSLLNNDAQSSMNGFDGLLLGEKKKRQRATPDQVAILEEAFELNSSPDAMFREALAKKCNMTERSIQIWFQNKRAKVKLINKKAQEAALQSQQLEQQQRLLFQFQQELMQSHYNLSPTSTKKMVSMENFIVQFPAKTLKIGTWQRISLNSNDLLCGIDIDRDVVKWIMSDGKKRYKIEFSITAISGISFETKDDLGLIQFDIRQTPNFYIESIGVDGSLKWVQSRDYTEQKQASTIFRHILTGPLNDLKNNLQDLMNIDPRFKSLLLTDLNTGKSLMQTKNLTHLGINSKSDNNLIQKPQPNIQKRKFEENSDIIKKQKISYVSPPITQKTNSELINLDDKSLDHLESVLLENFAPITPDDTPTQMSKMLNETFSNIFINDVNSLNLDPILNFNLGNNEIDDSIFTSDNNNNLNQVFESFLQ